MDLGSHLVRLINEAKLSTSGAEKLKALRSVEEVLRSESGAPLMREYASHVADFKVWPRAASAACMSGARVFVCSCNAVLCVCVVMGMCVLCTASVAR